MSLIDVLRNYRATHRLSGKLLYYILLVSSLLTLIGTGIQLYNDYQSDRGQINKDMQTIQDSFLRPLSNSIWNLDKDQVLVQLNGALKMRDLIYLEVEELADDLPRSLARVGEKRSTNVLSQQYPLIYDNGRVNVEVGRLYATFTLDGVHERLQNKVLLILGTQFVKTFLVSLCILAIIHLLITRHLHTLAQFASSIDFTNLAMRLRLQRNHNREEKDELDKVVDSFNELQDKLSVHLQERLAAEQALKEHKARLEDIVEQRTAALKQNMHMLEREIEVRKASELKATVASEQALAASKSKSEFLANMSHEIRTPMNAITGLSHLLKHTTLTAHQRDYLNKISGSSQSLLGIIDDILDFSKIEAGELKIEHIDFMLGDVLQQLSNVTAYAAFHKGLNLQFEVPAQLPHHLVGDPLRLGQVLKNLLSNAIKFTAQGDITLRISQQEGGGHPLMLKFSVQDSGIGMSPEQQTTIFESFKQADSSTTRQFGGTGLGLSICQRLVQLMGGDIGVESIEGQGSLFFFTVGFQQPANPKSLTAMIPTTMYRQTAILVTSHPPLQNQLLALMEPLNFKVQVVNSLASAEAAIQKQAVLSETLLVVDLIHADSSIAQLLTKYEGMPVEERPLLLNIVSSSGFDSEVSDKVQAIVENIISPPIFPARLVNAINDAYHHRQQPDTGSMTEITAIGLKGSRVLMAEDTPLNQLIVQEILQELGVMVDIVDNGQQAVEKFKANGRQYDVILMDLQMPVMDGYTATRAIRKLEYGAQVPIIALTAHTLSGDRDACINAGMNDYIAKPFVVDEMVMTIEKWFLQRVARPRASSR